MEFGTGPESLLTTLSVGASNMESIPGIKLADGRYACHFCPKVMRDKTDMRRHGRTHTGENPYVCEFCPYSCKQKGSLKLHRSRCRAAARSLYDV